MESERAELARKLQELKADHGRLQQERSQLQGDVHVSHPPANVLRIHTPRHVLSQACACIVVLLQKKDSFQSIRQA